MKWFILFLIVFSFVGSCKMAPEVQAKSDISFICIRDSDTLLVRINNFSKRRIFLPGLFIVCFNRDGDTLYLETLGKPKYAIDTFYQYSNIFPFGILTGQKIAGQKEDSVVVVKSQVYYFNQLKLRPFIKVEADSSYITSIVFNVPKKVNYAKAVFYDSNFIEKHYDKIYTLLPDFLHFDSAHAQYVIASVHNRFYLRNSSDTISKSK